MSICGRRRVLRRLFGRSGASKLMKDIGAFEGNIRFFAPLIAVLALAAFPAGCGSEPPPIEQRIQGYASDGEYVDVDMLLHNVSDKAISRVSIVVGPIEGSPQSTHTDLNPTDYREIAMPLAPNQSSSLRYVAYLGRRNSSWYLFVESVKFTDGSTWQDTEHPAPPAMTTMNP